MFHLLATRVVTSVVEVSGPVVGGVLTLPAFIMENGWPLWITCAPYAIFFVILAFTMVVQPPRLSYRTCFGSANFVGIVLALLMIVTVLLALSRGGIFEPWSSAKVSSLFVVGSSAAFALGMYETKYGRKPLLSQQVIRTYSQEAAVIVCIAHGFVSVAESVYILLPSAGTDS